MLFLSIIGLRIIYPWNDFWSCKLNLCWLVEYMYCRLNDYQTLMQIVILIYVLIRCLVRFADIIYHSLICNWNSNLFYYRIVSAIQALLSSFSGAVVCTFSCPKNMLRTSHFMSQAYAWFGASYFLYDVYSMFVVRTFKQPNLFAWKYSNMKTVCFYVSF